MPTVAGVSTTAGWVGSSGLPLTVNWPGAAAGQLVILPILARDTSITISTSSGYTLKSTDNATGTNISGEIQAKVAGDSEAAPSVTTSIANTQPTGAIVIVVDGWSGNLANVSVTQDAGANNTPLCPAGTAAVDDSLVLRGFLVADNNAVSTALTPVFNETTEQGSDATMAWWSETADAGAVASAAVTMTDADGWLSFTIVIPPGGDPFTDLADTFDDDSGLWPASYGGHAVTGGQAVVDCDTGQFSGFKSAPRYTLAGSHVGGEFFPPAANGGTSAYMAIFATTATAGTDAGFNIDAGFMGCLLRESFSDANGVFVAYDPDDHAWLRLREDSGTLYWEASPDGSTWSELRSETSPGWVSDPDLAFLVDSKRTDGTDNTGAFDNINTFPEASGETATLDGTLPAVTAAFTATSSADAALSGTLPAVTGLFAAQSTATAALTATIPAPTASFAGAATATAALAGTLPAPTGVFAATVGTTANLAGTLPAVTGSFTAAASADAALAGILPALVGAFLVTEPGLAPTRAAMTAAVAATRTSSPSVTGVRTAAAAATAANKQTSGVS